MSEPQKETHPRRSGAKGPDSPNLGEADNMSQDWLARLRETDKGWNEPAFPERAEDPNISMQAQRVAEMAADQDDDIPSRPPLTLGSLLRVAGLTLIGVAAIAWTAVVIASGLDPHIALRSAAAINLIAVLVAPLILLGGIAWLLAGRRSARRGSSRSGAARRREFAEQADQAATRLGDAHALLISQTRDFSSVADQSASAILGAIQSMSTQTGQLEQTTAGTVATLAALNERINAMTEAVPRLEDRLATLGETLARVGGDLGQRHDALDEQLRTTAVVAEEARLQLLDAGKALTDQLAGLRDGTREAGEELGNLAELSSARIDLTLDRVKAVVAATEKRIEAQNAALVDLVEKSRQEVESTSGQSLERFETHCRQIEAIIDTLDARILAQTDKSNAWLDGTAKGVSALTAEFNALEQSAIARTDALSATMMQLSGDTKRLIDAVDAGQGGADLLIKRAEALLVALDSGVRELDQSLPSAIGRVETQMGVLQERIRAASPAIEAVEAVAKGVVSQLYESDHLARSHVVALTDALQKSHGALNAQKQQIEALAVAVNNASDGIAKLGESVGPQLVEALSSVREAADAAAERARTAIAAVIPEAAAELGAASGQAVEKAVAKSVSDELERLSLVADDAVKAAHRATDKLTRQMLTLTDASKALESTLQSNAEQVETQDREQMAQRSARLIASLNERAIDVNKWLDKDVSEADWTSYLKGDQGLFARRATRLISGGEAKHVHALYGEDPDFREHVNRYVHDFEGLLRTVMATREGSTLALTMVSSDIGKLYVALAQAIERLRTQ